MDAFTLRLAAIGSVTVACLFALSLLIRLREEGMDPLDAFTRLVRRGAHLAQGIPALTPPTGFCMIPNVLDENANIDMNDSTSEYGILRPNQWPAGRPYLNRWCHSDMKDIAYFYVYKLYEQLVTRGGLQ